MRPNNQNKQRMRGRGRKGPNPLSRNYESNGPDVKIRGTALHVAEKYQQLARDAQASGDRIMSENYNQHAEHYLRIVAAAQGNAQPQAQPGAAEDAESVDAGQTGVSNGRRHRGNGRTDRADRHDNDGKPVLLDEDSPQPFIESMPVINEADQVNGDVAQAEVLPDGAVDEEKPRRKPRTTRGRSPRKTSSENEIVAETDNSAVTGDEGLNDAEEVAPKPRARRTTRPRRAKVDSQASPEQDSVSAGE